MSTPAAAFSSCVNAFKLGVFRGLLTGEEAAAAWKNLQKDLRGRLVSVAVKWPSVFRLAARLSEQYSAIHGTRSLDILHVATAKVMRVREFASFDARQRDLCAAVGLKVLPKPVPESFLVLIPDAAILS